MSTDIAALREEYTKGELDQTTVDKDPSVQFRKWFDEALKGQILEPNAMVLSTISSDGPAQRTVLMKALDERGLVFYTNYKSRKAKEMEEDARVSVLFPWYAMERQVLIKGKVRKVSTAESLKYFLSRPKGSQLGAWVSHQSEVISSRGLLEMKLEEMKSKFGNGEIPLPDFWGGYLIVPFYYEFWQGRKSRLHDRLEYKLDDEAWQINRLSP